MTPSTEVATADTAADVALSERERLLAELREEQEAEFEGERFVTPILKIGEALTKEVQDDDNPSQAGDFINSLTGMPIGREVEFIITFYQRGRFAVDPKTKRVFVAFTDEIPEAWEDLSGVGPQFVGTRFDQHPDAEEQYKARVNRGDIEWGKGPLISTTYNYTGLAVVPVRDAEDQLTGETELQPVRLPLKRVNTKSADKINTLRATFLRSPKMFWDRVFVLTTKKESFPSGPAHVIVPTLGRATTDEEKEAALGLRMALKQGRVDTPDEAQDTLVKPDTKGGLSV